MMTMFRRYPDGYKLHSGGISRYKLELDAATQEDVDCWAWMIRQMVGPFGSVEGVLRGGLQLAKALARYVEGVNPIEHPHLIVDDVLTTGKSMQEAYQRYQEDVAPHIPRVVGAVVYARSDVHLAWIEPLFRINYKLVNL